MNHIFKPFKSVLTSKYFKIASPFSTSRLKAKYIDEPEYLKLTKPQVPVYDVLDIQLKGYDFTVLEHYGKHVHKVALNMDIDVVDAWATPHQAWKVTNHQFATNKVSTEYALNMYERNIQIANVAVYSAPLFFEVIRTSLPAGVTVSIHPHELQHDEIRYIPDFELIALKNHLKELEEETEK